MTEVKSDEEPFPLWDQPATRGDLIRVTTQVLGLLTRMTAVTQEAHRGDPERMREQTKLLKQQADILQSLIFEIGGGRHGD